MGRKRGFRIGFPVAGPLDGASTPGGAAQLDGPVAGESTTGDRPSQPRLPGCEARTSEPLAAHQETVSSNRTGAYICDSQTDTIKLFQKFT